MSKILVTGVAGFMGSHLSEYLANQGQDVYGIDNESTGLARNVPKNVKYAKIDMRNTKDMAELIEEIKPELIYHLAAWAHEGLSQFMPILITENNYNAFLNLIVPAIKNGMRRIVVCSSMSVYGSQTPPFDEDMPRLPADVYAVAKTAMEQTTEILADVHGFDYTIVRPHNVYGPRQALHDPYRNVVGIFCNRLLKGQPPIIYGDGKQTRAFTYIDDVTSVLASCGFLNEAKSHIFNIGPTKEYSINELAEEVLYAFGHTDGKLAPIHVADRPREVKEAYSTNSKARGLLGYKAKTELRDGIKQMVEWAKTMGSQEFKYLDKMELEGVQIPETWTKRLI